jgi:hypothetical protein
MRWKILLDGQSAAQEAKFQTKLLTLLGDAPRR